jgi:hypothetical protein
LPLGPAFIQATIRVSPRDRYLIAAGYEWRDATNGTAAGWVRPNGRAFWARPLSDDDPALLQHLKVMRECRQYSENARNPKGAE